MIPLHYGSVYLGRFLTPSQKNHLRKHNIFETLNSGKAERKFEVSRPVGAHEKFEKFYTGYTHAYGYVDLGPNRKPVGHRSEHPLSLVDQ